ncbi:MAG: hypothetical protein V1813_03585 [Candidatus Aenigmatarchaeota archaeon]
MKGLSMTLEIVIIAIVLLVTALVILTIFGGQMANVLSALGILQTSTVESSQCQTMCSNWCLVNRPDTKVAWTTLTFTRNKADGTGPETIGCNTIMSKLGSTECKCTI